jgi:hypothetical protein
MIPALVASSNLTIVSESKEYGKSELSIEK